LVVFGNYQHRYYRIKVGRSRSNDVGLCRGPQKIWALGPAPWVVSMAGP